MDEGFSVQLKHDKSEDYATIGDVAIKTSGGAAIAKCAAFQHNRNLMRRDELAATLAKETVTNFDLNSMGSVDCGADETAAAEELDDGTCCGKKKTTGDCCGAYKKAEKDCCADGTKAEAAATSCCASSCCYSTPQLLMLGVGLGLALGLAFYFSSPGAAPAEASASILPDGMVGETVEA